MLIIDYTDAFGTKAVRAISGDDPAVVGSEIWLPDWLTPIDIDAPVSVIDSDPARYSVSPGRRRTWHDGGIRHDRRPGGAGDRF